MVDFKFDYIRANIKSAADIQNSLLFPASKFRYIFFNEAGIRYQIEDEEEVRPADLGQTLHFLFGESAQFVKAMFSGGAQLVAERLGPLKAGETHEGNLLKHIFRLAVKKPLFFDVDENEFFILGTEKKATEADIDQSAVIKFFEQSQKAAEDIEIIF